MTAFSAAAAIGNLVAGGDIILSVAARALVDAAALSGLPIQRRNWSSRTG